MLNVLETTKYVIENSKLVKINQEKIKELARKWKKEGVKIPKWDDKHHYFDNSWRTCEYLFILDSLNFGGNYFDWASYLRMAFEQDETIALSLSKEKIKILEENYKILDKKYDDKTCLPAGRFVNLINKCHGDAIKLVSEIVKNFPSFRDEAKYKGRKIGFYKRAQILAGDLYASFNGKKLGKLKNLDKLTAFADYKVPQILRYYGILEYKDKLAKKVDNKKPIFAGSKEEIEIRASMIWAIEFLKNELKKLGINLRSFEIDWILWNKAQNKDLKLKPRHLTKTIFY